MKEVLFSFDRSNYRNCQSAYRGVKNQEYYLGDYRIEGCSQVDVRAERKVVGSCSIIHLRARNRLRFNRSWHHIQQDGTDVTVFWFVRRGRLIISRNGECHQAGPGDLALTQSLSPFSIECSTDEEAQQEVFHLVVPTHLLVGKLGRPLKNTVVIAGNGAIALAERILTDVFDGQGELASSVQAALVDAALTLLADVTARQKGVGTARQSQSEFRFQEVLRFIDLHVSDPCLNVEKVAGGCGISPRYLSTLLKLQGTRFTTVLWDKRLAMAKLVLDNASSRELSVSEVAYRTGFKSPAHFSRMFKRVVGQSPRDYRVNRQGLRERACSSDTP